MFKCFFEGSVNWPCFSCHLTPLDRAYACVSAAVLGTKKIKDYTSLIYFTNIICHLFMQLYEIFRWGSTNLFLQLSPYASSNLWIRKMHVMISFFFWGLQLPSRVCSSLDTNNIFDASPEEAAKSKCSDLIFKLFHFLYWHLMKLLSLPLKIIL